MSPQQPKAIENAAHVGALAAEIDPKLRTVEVHLGPEMAGEIGLPLLRLGGSAQHIVPNDTCSPVRPSAPLRPATSRSRNRRPARPMSAQRRTGPQAAAATRSRWFAACRLRAPGRRLPLSPRQRRIGRQGHQRRHQARYRKRGFRRAGVGAGMLNDFGDRHVVGIAERGRERDGHCAGVVRETPHKFAAVVETQIRANANTMYSE